MENAVILKTGKVVRKSSFITGSLKIDLQGFVDQFAIGNPDKVYKHVSKNKFNLQDLDGYDKPISAGYYLESGFLKYMANIITFEELNKYALKDTDLLFAKDGDKIEVFRLHIKAPFDYFYKLEKFDVTFRKNIEVIDSNQNIIIPTNKEPTIINFDDVTSTSHQFYNKRISITNAFNESKEKNSAALLITKIALMINKIEREIFSLFTVAGNNFESYVRNQLNEWLSDQILINPSLEDLVEFEQNITDYYRVAYSNQLKILEAVGEEKLYWLALGLSSQSISFLSVSDKIEILKYLIKYKLSDHFEKLKDEELIVNIVASFNSSNINEIDSFLEKFISIQPDSDTNQTLYEVLYRKMSKSTNFKESLLGLSNWALKTDYKPTSTRSQFVQILYVLWQFSKYCPYNDDFSIKPYTIGFKNVNNNSIPNFSNEIDYKNYLFHYSHDTAYSAEEITTLPEHLTEKYFTYKMIYEDASPMIIPYESEKEYGVFFDNFSFVINGNKIKAYQEFETWGCSTNGAPSLTSSDYDKWINYHRNDCDEFYQSKRKINILYGTYDIFQPVSLINTNIETKTAISTVYGENIIENGKTVNSFIPIFILAHIDEEGDKSDVESAIGYTVDIALTFSAVGNLSKLRHLRWASTGAETFGLFTIQGLNVIIDTLTFTSQILNYISLIAGDCATDDDFCKRFKNFSDALNLACLSVNAGRMVGVASITLAKQSYYLVESIRAGATTENLIKANLKARLLLSNANATAEVIDDTVNNIYSLFAKNGNLYATPIGGFLSITFGAYKFAKLLFDKITTVLIKQQNKLYGVLEDSPIGSESSHPPRFSPFKYEEIVKEIEGYKKTFYKRTSQLIHTEEEFSEIIRKGKSLGFKDDLILHFTLKSYRVAKPKTYQQVIDYMDKYNEFIVSRNSVPFCFGSASHLADFNSHVINLIKKYNLEENLYEFQISGSALYQNLVSDLDLAGYTFAGKLKKIYLKSGNIYVKERDIIVDLLQKQHFKKPQAAKSIIQKLDKFYEPLRDANGDINKINAIVVDQMSSSNILRLETVGNKSFFYTLSDELYQIRKNSSIKPNLAEGKFKIDFNIFVQGGNGRRLQPDLTIKIN